MPNCNKAWTSSGRWRRFRLVANPATTPVGLQLAGGHPGLARPAGGRNRFRYWARFAGRQFELVREVTEYEPKRRRAVKTISGSLRFGGVRTFELSRRVPGAY